jgi:hypothetical protein
LILENYGNNVGFYGFTVRQFRVRPAPSAERGRSFSFSAPDAVITPSNKSNRAASGASQLMVFASNARKKAQRDGDCRLHRTALRGLPRDF